jgi:hypothetical protein
MSNRKTRFAYRIEKDKSGIQREIDYGRDDKQDLILNPETKARDRWLYWHADFFKRQQGPEQHK